MARYGSALLLLASLVAVSCGLAWRPALGPSVRPVDARLAPVARGLRWLEGQQVDAVQEAVWGRDWAGAWPQTVRLRGAAFLPPIRDVNPFLATFVHHALCTIEETEAAGLTPEDLERVRRMRRRAAAFLRRFRVETTEEGVDVYGFWPPRGPARDPVRRAVGGVLLAAVGGPRLHGTLAPWNVPAHPPELQAWPDADDTALVHAALADEARREGEPQPETPLDTLFASRRDLGRRPIRFPRDLPHASGLFLTWLLPPTVRIPNNVDLVVNANVVRTLARAGARATLGFDRAVEALNEATRSGRHHDLRRMSEYYPDRLAFAWIVARAYREGPVPALEPAVGILADEVEAAACPAGGGAACWPGSEPALATAQALLVLLDAGRDGALVDAGVAYLLRTQDETDGGWPEGVLCVGHSLSGKTAEWRSRAITTALALEVLVRRPRESGALDRAGSRGLHPHSSTEGGT